MDKSLILSAWITAIATSILAVITIIYARLTKMILDAQSDPCVILSVVHDTDRPTMIQLVAKNIGTGLAHDIKFEFSRPLPEKAFGITENEAKEIQFMKQGPFIEGIPALGPGECRKIDWGQYGGLMKAIGEDPIIATCHFKKNGKIMPLIECPLDIMSFKGTNASGSMVYVFSNKLELLSNNIDKLVVPLRYISNNISKLYTNDESANEDKT